VLKTTIGFRAATHDDVEFAAAVVTAADPDHPQLAEELLEMWVNTEKGFAVRRFVAQEDRLDRGWISLVQPCDQPGRPADLNLLIPAAYNHLLPAAIAFGEAEARKMDAPLLVCGIRVDRVDVVDSLRREGWTEERKERFWRLDLEANAGRIHDLQSAAQRRLEGTDFVITTVARLGGEAFLPRLHAVGTASSADIPRSVEHIPPTYEAWLAWMQPPSVLPERIWVAVLQGEPIGYSFLAYQPSEVSTGYTGVLREHRGKGLARALKLATLVQAIDLGVTAVGTDNDSENAPILHLNEELGYDEIPGKLAFHRQLS
jgi:GNAT superfamily N-acetyltransferase